MKEEDWCISSHAQLPPQRLEVEPHDKHHMSKLLYSHLSPFGLCQVTVPDAPALYSNSSSYLQAKLGIPEVTNGSK